MLYIVNTNYDWDEDFAVFRTRPEAVEYIREAFDIDPAEYVPDTPEFWEEVSMVYEAGKWKGLQFISLNPETLEWTEVEG